ncbi:MAG TPA: dehydrogenase E1 component subunit alpha/beta [Candidatus Kapabacteria bacterium]|nr:dehydrogenase E1 component subunit alpha/beta [Candidatus Kapabacteria bacterium]
MAKKTQPIKKNSNEDSPEEIMRKAIEDSHIGSPCSKSDGESCSSEKIKISQKDENTYKELGLTKYDLFAALKNMMKARYTDEKHLTLVKQGKSYFHIGGSGHEAVQTAIGFQLDDSAWGWTYYRDLAFVYSRGFTPRDYFLLAFGKKDDPATGGRQMPGHYGHPKLNLPTQSSPTGTQFLNAVGTALASKKLGTNEIVYVASGEGTTSQGEFYEAVNWASRDKLPVIFCIQDNGYAISVPREKQSMGESVGHTFCCYQNLKMMTFDGTDYLASVKAAKEAIEYINSGRGPVLMHALVERLLPHSSSDDHRKYRKEDELNRIHTENDCIKILANYLVDINLSDEDEINRLWDEVKKEIDEAADWAWEQPDPIAEESTLHIFAPEETRNLPYAQSEPKEGQPIVLVDAVNHALAEEMRLNPKMLIFGEDIADPKGGVFTATRGLTNEFGEERVFNSPLAEASIVGVALGLAVRGFKPVVEIQFGDYIWPAFMQIKNEVATLRYRSNGGFSCPMVIRVAVGGYIHGGLCHSQNIESIFSHIPGLMIAYPSNAADAKGLLKTACRLQDPVLFLEHKGMYRLPFARTIEPDANYLIPFGKGKVVKEGKDLTIVTYGMGVKDSINAAKNFEKNNRRTIEIIDLRTIIPWDVELVLNSVRKTGKLLIVHEDTMTTGFGAEIAATVAEKAFQWLDAPIERLAAEDSHIPYAPVYEEDVLPNEKKVFEKIEKIISF